MVEEQADKSPSLPQRRLSADEQLMEAVSRNPSRAGRELMIEILARGREPEQTERPRASDIRAALQARSLDDPDYRTAAEQAGWLGRESQEMRDLYERGAVIKGETLIIPAEGHELREDAEQPFITTVAYAQQLIREPAKAVEFHALGRAIAGETSDTRGEVATFRFYYDRVNRDEQGRRLAPEQFAECAAALERTLTEMRAVASAMRELETQHSVEIARPIVSLEQTREGERGGTHEFDDPSDRYSPDGQPELADGRETESFAGGMNTSARRIWLRAESLRLPAGLSDEAEQRLIAETLPAIDRRLESGTPRQVIFAAIDGHQRKLDEVGQNSPEQREEWFKISGFIKAYTDERLNEPETRALNRSPAFRAAHAKINAARTPQELSRIAGSFLRENYEHTRALRLQQDVPGNAPPLDARERHLLFFGRSPEHFSPQMRQLKHDWGLSREERTARTTMLREGELEPSRALKAMLRELDSRASVRAVAHYQATIINERVENPGKLDLRSLHESLAPHERDYLFERVQERKRVLARSNTSERNAEEPPDARTQTSATGRAFGQTPVASGAYRDYLAAMGAIERQLLNEAVRRRETGSRAGRTAGEGQLLSITEARVLLPSEERLELRLRARNLAWEAVVPPEVLARNPSPAALRLSDTIAQVQEQLQERARIAHTARERFIQEQLAPAEKHLREARERDAYHDTFKTRMQELQRAPDERGGRAGVAASTGSITEEAHRAGLEASAASRQRPLFASQQAQEQFTQRVLEQLAPAEARKLAELDRYAAETREDVYRGFETIDSLRRELELARTQRESAAPPSQQALGREGAATVAGVRLEGVDRLSSAARELPSQIEPGNLREEQRSESPADSRWSYVDSDQEWHFESLRELLPAAQHRESAGRDELSHEHSDIDRER